MERARVLLKTDAKTPNERQHHVLCGVSCYFIREWRQQWPATAREPGAVRQARPAAISEMSATVAVYRYIMLVSMALLMRRLQRNHSRILSSAVRRTSGIGSWVWCCPGKCVHDVAH